MLDRWEPVVDLKRAVPSYKPYVFPACSFDSKNHSICLNPSEQNQVIKTAKCRFREGFSCIYTAL